MFSFSIRPGMKIVLRLALISLALLAAITLVTNHLLSQKDEKIIALGYKTIEFAIQVFLVVIAGGVVVQEYSRGQARRMALNESCKVMLRQLIQAYSRTKKARRLLRANCCLSDGLLQKNSDRAVEYVAYGEQLAIINETQLELEVIARELKVIQSGFATSDAIRTQVKIMEKCLNELVDEFERTLGECDPKQPIPLSRLPKLKDFIAKGADESFSPYSGAFHNALDMIQEEKLKG